MKRSVVVTVDVPEDSAWQASVVYLVGHSLAVAGIVPPDWTVVSIEDWHITQHQLSNLAIAENRKDIGL